MRTLPILFLLAPLSASAMGNGGDVIQFCNATVNSTGAPAVLDFTGSVEAADGNFQFAVADVPSGNFGMLMLSYGSVAEYPFGNGVLCLNPYSPTGLHRASAPFLASETMTEIVGVLPSMPQAGQWHYFQAFYRDVQSQGFNTSTAVGIEFVLP